MPTPPFPHRNPSPTGRCSARSGRPWQSRVSHSSHQLHTTQASVIALAWIGTWRRCIEHVRSPKRNLVRSDALPRIEVDPETFAVKVDGHWPRCRRPAQWPQTGLSSLASNGDRADRRNTPPRRGRPRVGARAPWADRLRHAHIDLLRLDQRGAQKSRLRKRTDEGVDLALSLDGGTPLRDGDVLLWDEQRQSAVVAHVELSEIIVIDMTEVLEQRPEQAMATSVEVGHALGNQHWPAVVKGPLVYVPLVLSRAVMSSVMKTHALGHVRLCQLPCRRALARARKARMICSGAVSRLNCLMGVQLGFMGVQLGSKVIWAGSQGLQLRCGNFRAAAGGCHRACQMMERRGAGYRRPVLACSSIPADRDHRFRRSGARIDHATGRYRRYSPAGCRPGRPLSC